MSRDLTLLDDDFQVDARELLAALLMEGHQLRPFFTRRSPWEQARLWRQSRTTQEIHETAGKLSREGAEFLRKILLDVGPQQGRWATNALPGQSWHQWGEALDCFVLEGGRAVWRRAHPGYQRYADLAIERGLTPGYYWRRPDAVHVQKTSGRVRTLHSWIDIDTRMQEIFGTEES